MTETQNLTATHEVTDSDDNLTYFWDEVTTFMWDSYGHSYGPTPFNAHIAFVETGVWDEDFVCNLNDYRA